MASLLKITPGIIEFPIHLFQSITTTLRLDNVATSAVAFKIKTTAPKNYLVRPSTGVIGEGKSQEVQIILQPLPAEPQVPSPDRFLVQATTVDGETTSFSREFWSNLRKDELTDQRLNVSFKKDSSVAAGVGESEGENSEGGGAKPYATGMEIDSLSEEFCPTDFHQLKAKHTVLISSLRKSEAEKNQLLKDVENLRIRLQAALQQGREGGPSATAKAAGSSGTGVLSLFGFEIWHWIPIVIILVLLAKCLGAFDIFLDFKQ